MYEPEDIETLREAVTLIKSHYAWRRRRQLLQDYKRHHAALNVKYAAIKVLLAIRAGFDPDQPRDDQGRWSDSTDGGLAVPGTDSPINLQLTTSPGQTQPVRTSSWL